jgi:hypothetical protein
MSNNFIEQWDVPSTSNPNKTYKVSLVKILLTDEIQYQCSCKAWTTAYPRKHCKHIQMVLDGYFDEEPIIDYEIRPGNVGAVSIKNTKLILVPLIPLDETGTYVLATLAYDLLNIGIPWRKIKERYTMIPKEWTRDIVVGYIKQHGRYVYTEWVEGQGWTNPKWIPAP